MRCSSIWNIEGRGSEGMGCAGCEPEIWRRTFSCTKPSPTCPTYCGYCSSFWRLPRRHSLLVNRNEARWHLTAYCHLVATMCALHTCICGVQVDSGGSTASPVASPLIVICDTTPSTTSSSVLWRWRQTHCPETMENVLTVWRCCPGLTVVAWSVISHVHADNLATSHLNRSVLFAALNVGK